MTRKTAFFEEWSWFKFACLNEFFFPSGSNFTKNDGHVFFLKLRKWNVSDRLYENWLRITCPTFFQRSMAKSLLQWFHHWNDCRLSGKSMLENFPAHLQSWEELNSSVFEELQQQRFKKRDFSKYYKIRITT